MAESPTNPAVAVDEAHGADVDDVFIGGTNAAKFSASRVPVPDESSMCPEGVISIATGDHADASLPSADAPSALTWKLLILPATAVNVAIEAAWEATIEEMLQGEFSSWYLN